MLLGSELAYLAADETAGTPLILCGTRPVDAHYRAALDELGLTGRLLSIPPDDVELLSARGQAVWWRSRPAD